MAPTSSDRKLRDFLLAQSPAWLTERLLNAAASDQALLAGLQVAAGPDGAQIVRRELDRAIRVDEYVEWDDALTYVHNVHRALQLPPNGWVVMSSDHLADAPRLLSVERRIGVRAHPT